MQDFNRSFSIKHRLTVQLWLGVILSLSGILLLWVGLYLPPIGEISASVLTGFGEVATFSGALIGIDYSYRYQVMKFITHKEKMEQNDKEDGENK